MTGRQLIWAAALATAMAGCQGVPSPFSTKDADGEVRLVERDVEAPEVFQLSESGIWDGKPSLGAVWVAHADAAEPIRTIIRREGSDAFVIGMLYARSSANPGAGFQVSADAAEALGLAAGEAALLDVTALVPEQVAENTPAPGASPLDTAEPLPAADPIGTAELEPALSATPALATPEADATAQETASAQTAPVAPGGPAKPYVQVGIFSVEDNATGAVGLLREAGARAEAKVLESNGKTFWRVIAGPAGTESELDALTQKAREAGFADAFPTKS